MAQELPQFVAMQANYLHDFYASSPQQPKTPVRCSEPKVYDPSVKIEIERSKTNKKYVHLRFCHSNRYWQRCNLFFVIASSKQPVEDSSKSTCTLFEPIKKDNGYYSFRHVQSGWTVTSVGESTDGTIGTLILKERAGSDLSFLFTVVDWESLVILPKNLAFKGDNGRYLKSEWIAGRPYLKFSSNDSNEQETAYQVTMLPHGHLVIKSVYFGKYWRRSPNWIWGDSNDNSGINPDTLFWPVKATVDSNIIALRNEGNHYFCKRLTADSKESCLCAASPTITTETKLELVELVIDRKLYNIVYHMDDARILDETPYIVGTGTGNNNTNIASKLTIRVAYQESKSYSFTNNISVTLGVSTKIIAGFPMIVNGEIEVSAEVTTEFEWDRTTTETKSAEATYEVVVPANSKVTVNYVATKGTCNVPFTYTQRDRSSVDGKIITTTNRDGIFTGVNSYNFHFENAQVVALLPPPHLSAL